MVPQAHADAARVRAVLDLGHTVAAQHQGLRDQWGPQDPWKPCPNSKARFLVEGRPSGIPAPCRRPTCLACARMMVREREDAIRLSRPTGLVTLTGASPVSEVNGKRLKRLRYYLQRVSLPTPMIWAVEPNPSGTGYHLHAWTTADMLDGPLLQERAHLVGFGMADVRAVTHHGGLGYPMKNATWNETSLASHLELNDGRLLTGRGWYRDGATGEALTQREATARWRGVSGATRAEYVPTSRRWHGSALPPKQAERIRARRHRIVTDLGTGEVLLNGLAREPLGHGVVGTPVLSVQQRGRPRQVLLDGVLRPVGVLMVNVDAA